MDRERCVLLRIAIAVGLMGAAPSLAGAGQLFLVQTPSGNGTGMCVDPLPSCSLAGLLGTDTALNAGGRLTDFPELGQTGPIPPGVNIFAHIGAGQTPETVTIVYSIDGLHGGNAWSQVFSALLIPGDTGELKTYSGSTLGARTTLLATQTLDVNGHVALSGTFDFGPGPYALTDVLTLNLQPGTGQPDYGRLLESPSGFYYGTLTVTAPEPATLLLLSLGVLAGCGKKINDHRSRARSLGQHPPPSL